jgi:hypothetical protein
MKKPSLFRDNIKLIALFFLFSVVFLIAQLLIFKRTSDTFFYIFQDMIFLPINAIIVSFILGNMIRENEKKERKSKTIILINEFYAESGEDIIIYLNKFIVNLNDVANCIDIKTDWAIADFSKVANKVSDLKVKFNITDEDLDSLYIKLLSKKLNILRLFENQSILEHDQFTEMLWAVYHLFEELRNRNNMPDINEKDIEHIKIDLRRAYITLVKEWILYMQNLKFSYPYLFSLSVRKAIFTTKSIGGKIK